MTQASPFSPELAHQLRRSSNDHQADLDETDCAAQGLTCRFAVRLSTPLGFLSRLGKPRTEGTAQGFLASLAGGKHKYKDSRYPGYRRKPSGQTSHGTRGSLAIIDWKSIISIFAL